LREQQDPQEDRPHKTDRRRIRRERLTEVYAARTMSSGACGMAFKAHVAVHEWLGDEIKLWFDPATFASSTVSPERT
jgi:hypothetical protein